MGRTTQKLKQFIEKSLQKNYINFKKENNVFKLHTPRFKDSLDPAFEKIFKAYEIYNKRKYVGYKENKDTLKSAIRKSKFYKVLSTSNHQFLFQERTASEIENLKEKKVEKNVVVSSPSSGYESSDYHCTTEELEVLPEVGKNESVSVDKLMQLSGEDMQCIKMSEEEYLAVLNDVLRGETPAVNEMEQYCKDEDINMDVEKHGENSAGETPVNEMVQNEDISMDIEEYGKSSADSATYELKKFNVHKYQLPDGKSVFVLVEE